MKCAHCKQFFYLNNIIQHIRKDHNSQFKCGEVKCSRVFSQGRALSLHFKSAHAAQYDTITEDFITSSSCSQSIIKNTPNKSHPVSYLNIEDYTFNQETQAKKIVLELHSKDNINRTQVSSIVKLVVRHLIEPLLSSNNFGDEFNFKNEINSLMTSLEKISNEYNLINSLVKQNQYIRPLYSSN